MDMEISSDQQDRSKYRVNTMFKHGSSSGRNKISLYDPERNKGGVNTRSLNNMPKKVASE